MASNKKLDWKEYLVPGDTIYIVVIVIGIFIMIVTGDLPIRLIGACVAILSGILLVLNISSRLRDGVEMRKPQSTQQVELTMKMKKDASGTTRYVFDDFDSAFSTDDDSNDSQSSPKQPKRMRIDDTEGNSTEIESLDEHSSSQRKSTSSSNSPSANKKNTDASQTSTAHASSRSSSSSIGYSAQSLDATEFESDIRIVGVKSAVEQTRLLNQEREELRKQEKNRESQEKQKNNDSSGKKTKKKLQDDRTNEDLAPETAVLPQSALDYQEAQQQRTSNISHSNIADKAKPTFSFALSELLDDMDDDINGDEPRKEFEILLQRVLMTIRSIMNARTAAFFWYNHDRSELVVESYISDVEDVFVKERKLPLGIDIVSQIAINERPEILTFIQAPAELDLLPYYTEKTGTSSFVGVPVFLQQTVIGILCADSVEEEAYDEITVGVLGHFTKLISGLTKSYTGKYDLVQSSRTLDALMAFRSLLNADVQADVDTITSALIEASSSVLEFKTIGVVTYDSDREGWTIKHCMSNIEHTDILQGEIVESSTSLIANTLHSGKTTMISPVSSSHRRYHNDEPEMNDGCFVSVALRSVNSVLGSLFVEGETTQFTERDVAILETLGEQAGMLIGQIQTQESVRSLQLLDEETNLLNGTAFLQRLREEVARSYDLGISLMMCIINIDTYISIEKIHDDQTHGQIVRHVLSIVKPHLRDYDFLGRLDTSMIGVSLSGMKDNDIQLLCERIRKEIAIHPFELNSKKFLVTVSIGLARAKNSDTAESLLTNAHIATQAAMKKANTITVYS